MTSSDVVGAPPSVASSGPRDDVDSVLRALAPRPLPLLPGLRLAVRYLPWGDGLAGGDFFQVLPLPGRRAAVVFGDVAGHGPSVAPAMAQLLTALRAYTLEGHPPVEVLQCANRLVLLDVEPVYATCCIVEVDADGGVARVVVAGHLPPLLLPLVGTPVLLRLPPGLPLGVLPDPPLVQTVLPLAPGEGLVLYSDGLVESREVTLDVGLDLLVAVAADADRQDPEHLVDQLVTRVRPTSSRDDAAVLAMVLDPLP